MVAYRDITHCAGHEAHICERCWRRTCPVPEGEMVSNADWTPNAKGRGWCEGYLWYEGYLEEPKYE